MAPAAFDPPWNLPHLRIVQQEKVMTDRLDVNRRMVLAGAAAVAATSAARLLIAL